MMGGSRNAGTVRNAGTTTVVPPTVSLAIIALLWVMGGLLSTQAEERKIKVLVMTGGHGFEREAFFNVFKENQSIEFSEAKHGKSADGYERKDLLRQDVVVLYDMPKTITDEQKENFLALTKKGVGLVVLHHALVSYQHWP